MYQTDIAIKKDLPCAKYSSILMSPDIQQGEGEGIHKATECTKSTNYKKIKNIH